MCRRAGRTEKASGSTSTTVSARYWSVNRRAGTWNSSARSIACCARSNASSGDPGASTRRGDSPGARGHRVPGGELAPPCDRAQRERLVPRQDDPRGGGSNGKTEPFHDLLRQVVLRPFRAQPEGSPVLIEKVPPEIGRGTGVRGFRRG